MRLLSFRSHSRPYPLALITSEELELERDGSILEKHVQPPHISQYVSRPRAARLRRAETSPSITLPPPSYHYVSKARTQYSRRAQTTASVPAPTWQDAMPTSFGHMPLPGLSGAAMQQQQQQPNRGAVAASSSSSSAAAGHAASLPSSSTVRPPPDCDLHIGAGDIDLSTPVHHHQGFSERSASGNQPRAPFSSAIRKTQGPRPQLRPASAHAAATSTSPTTKAMIAESPVKGSRSEASAVTPGEDGQVVDRSLGEEKRENDEGRARASSSGESYTPASIQRKTSTKRKQSQRKEGEGDKEDPIRSSEASVGDSGIPSGRELRSGKMSVKKEIKEGKADEGGKASAGTSSKICKSTAGSRKRHKAMAEGVEKVKEEDEVKDDTTSSSNSTMGMRLRTASQRKKPAKWDC